MKIRLIFPLLISFFLISVSRAYPGYRLTQVIDMPTAHSVDLSTYKLSFRLFAGGSVITRLHYGIIMDNLSLGLSLNTENLIGEGNVDVRRPCLYAKIPLYSGDINWPALSFGFDEQGYGAFDEDSETYRYPPVGFFVAATREGLMPGFNLTLGLNYNDSLPGVEEGGFRGFGGVDYLLGPEFMILAEVRDIEEEGAVVNAGFKYLLHPRISFELNFSDLADSDRINRIVRAVYKGSF